MGDGRWGEAFAEPLPAAPGDPGEILRLLHEHGSPATVAQTGGRYFGFVNGSSVPTALAARWLADVWDQNAPLYVISPVISQLESALLGLGRARVELAPVDDQGRIIASGMPKLDRHCLVIAQAGNVNSGAFDPLDEICDRAREAGAWVHIDGAFGLWAAASRAKKHLARGLEKADSWSVDAHKTLNAPYDCGVILCRHREALVSAVQASASYILYSDRRDGMHFTPEMSRRARAVELWATLKSLGRDGVEELVDRLCVHAVRFAEGLRSKGFRIMNDVVFNQVLVACDTPELTKATLENIQKSGVCWCGGAVWRGEPVIRISVCSWATTTEDVERSIGAFVRARDKGPSILLPPRGRNEGQSR